ncbi:MAG TPA: hypothetical protein VJL29_03650 [Thermoguttaceae bacterium]|nr:hypothetical protein [Thermoguttaceae bacterium]
MPILPTEDELKQLPLRAIVAYAARCARRVQPDFQPKEDRYVAVVREAIVCAENFARADESKRVDVATIAAEAYRISRIHVAAATAYYAADATRHSIAAVRDSSAEAAEKTVNAALAAAMLTADAAPPNDRKEFVMAAAVRDYQNLVSLGLGSFPEPGKPVDASEKGPLGWFWPTHERLAGLSPREFRRSTAHVRAREMSLPGIEVFIDPGKASKEVVQAVLESLSDLHRATEGLGLEFAADELYVFATEEAPT